MRHLSRTAAVGMLLVLAVSLAWARTRTPHVRRPAAAQELQFTRTNRMRPRGGSAHLRESRARGARSSRAEARIARGRRSPASARDRRESAAQTRTLAARHGVYSSPGRFTGHETARRRFGNDPRAESRSQRVAASRNFAATDYTRAAAGTTASRQAATRDAADWANSAPAPSDGIYARGQSRPDDDERLPVRRSGAPGSDPQPVAEPTVESDDPAAAPVERPPALRTLSPDGEDDSYREAQAETSSAEARGSGPQLGGISPALVHPSQQELAEAAVQPVVLPGLYRDGRLVMPPPLKGSHDILVHQNLMAHEEGLERIRNQGDLDRLRANHELISFPESASLRLNPELAWDRRCARAWTVRFATDIAHAFYAEFHEPLQLSSAARTVQFQLRLQRVNGNAAQVAGDAASPHLTGEAIDFGKSGMSRDEIAWMRAYLLPLMQAGKIDVEEEFQQACFHISVYRSYVAGAKRPGITIEQAQLQ